MYPQQRNKQMTQNVLHQPQHYANNYPQNQQQHYNPNTQFSNVSHNQSHVSKFTAQQHWNQQQQHHFGQQNDYQTAALSLHNISHNNSAATIPSGHYQQHQQSVEIQGRHQQRITPPPLDPRVGPTPVSQYSLPMNPYQPTGQQQQIRENNFNNQYSSSSQFQYPSTSYSHHSTGVNQSFPTWTNTKDNTKTSVSNSICPQQLGNNSVQFNKPPLSVNSSNSTSMASWHRPTETQPVLPPQRSVQSYSTISSGCTTSMTSPPIPVLQNMVETEKNPPDLTNLISYLKEPPPLVKNSLKSSDPSNQIDDQITERKISQQEVRRQEAPLRDLKKMYRLQKQSENSEVFRKPKEKHKPSQFSETLKSVSPKHRIASPDSTLLPEVSQPKTAVAIVVPANISDDFCEPPLSPMSDSDATVCYGQDDDVDESLKRRCKDFDSPVREVKPVSLKRGFDDGDVEYENIEKRIKMISPSPSRECDSTNEFVEEHSRNNCQDRLTPSTPDPIVGCVIYNDVFHVRYLLRDTNKYYLLNDMRPFLRKHKPLLKSIIPIQNYETCTELEEKLLNCKYSKSYFSAVVTPNTRFVAFEEDPEIHCQSIRVQELSEKVDTDTASEVLDNHIHSAQEISHGDSELDNTADVNKPINNNTDSQPVPLSSVTLKNELDKLSGMAQEVIHGAFSSLLEECRSLQEQNQQLTEQMHFKDEKLQSYEDIIRDVSSIIYQP